MKEKEYKSLLFSGSTLRKDTEQQESCLILYVKIKCHGELHQHHPYNIVVPGRERAQNVHLNRFNPDLLGKKHSKELQKNRSPTAEHKTEVLWSYHGNFKYQKPDQHEGSKCGQCYRISDCNIFLRGYHYGFQFFARFLFQQSRVSCKQLFHQQKSEEK